MGRHVYPNGVTRCQALRRSFLGTAPNRFLGRTAARIFLRCRKNLVHGRVLDFAVGLTHAELDRVEAWLANASAGPT